MILGGVKIPSDFGLVGHSDADVLLHAVVDAILGATASGDIGELFPDTDPQYKGKDSKFFLEQVLLRTLPKPRSIVNIDCIIFAQKPKLSPFKINIRDSLAKLLGISKDRVNIKAKTGELVGPIGRQEAMSAEVVVLIDMG